MMFGELQSEDGRTVGFQQSPNYEEKTSRNKSRKAAVKFIKR